MTLSRVITCLLLVSFLSAADRDPRDIFPKPTLSAEFGTYLVVKLVRSHGAGTFPVSFNQFDVLEIDGKKTEGHPTILVAGPEDQEIAGADPVTAIGFETVLEVGRPANPPAGSQIAITQQNFHFRNLFRVVATK